MTDSTRYTTPAGTQAVFRTTALRKNETPASAEHGPVRGAPTRGALYDPITGLPNEHLLLSILAKAQQIDGTGDDHPTLIVLEIERIARIAACFGPALRKDALAAVARRLESLTPPEGLLARTGEQEFAFLLPSSTGDTARHFAAHAVRHLRQPITIDRHAMLPTTRIGIAVSETPTEDGRAVLDNARLAMRGPAAPATVYDAYVRQQAIDSMQLEADLSLAIDRDELRLDYQPIVSIETGAVAGFEALLRWEHALHGTILPEEIIPMANETGLIAPVGDWALNEACRQMAAWQRRFPDAAGLTMNVNLSAYQVEQPDLVHRVLKAQQSAGLEPGTLRLELTEATIISNQAAIERLEELQRHGIEIQLDDFGSGYSSLGYLGRLPINSLKLDQTFLEQCETDSRSATILDAIVALARELGLTVTAEGIETPEQAERIRSLACESGQGYFFHRPLNGKAVEQLLAA